MNMRNLTIGCVLVCCGSAASAQVIQGTLSNFDVWNRTGQVANDFHIELGGILPEMIDNLYLGDYPNASINATGNGTSVTWTNSSTNPGDVDHFGVRLNGAQNPNGVSMNWTFDGNNIGNIGDVSQRWFAGQGIVTDDITNRTDNGFWIQRRVNTLFTPGIVLDDLLVGLPIWESSTLIDFEPVFLDQGQSLLFDFDFTADASAFVMMYEVFADNNGNIGDPVLTFLNAAVIPAPGAVAPLAIAGLMTIMRKRT